VWEFAQQSEESLSWAVLQLLFSLRDYFKIKAGLSWAVLQLLFGVRDYFKIESLLAG